MEWHWDPVILLLIFLTCAAYLRGAGELHRRQGKWLADQKHRIWAFCGGMLAIFIALISPVDPLGEQLFSAHMVQHILLMDVAAPLLAYSAPLGLILLAVPAGPRHAVGRWWGRPPAAARRIWGWVSQPAAAWIAFASLLWLWHIPGLYSAAVENEAIHALEHFCFLGSGLLFWWNVFNHFGRHPGRRGAGVFYLVTYALQSSALGALLILSPAPWYSVYAQTTAAFAASPLADQQLAGVIMEIPEGAVYLLGALIMLRAWLAGLEDTENQPRQITIEKQSSDEPPPERLI